MSFPIILIIKYPGGEVRYTISQLVLLKGCLNYELLKNYRIKVIALIAALCNYELPLISHYKLYKFASSS